MGNGNENERENNKDTNFKESTKNSTINMKKNLEKKEVYLKQPNYNQNYNKIDDVLIFLKNFQNEAQKYTAKLSEEINTIKKENFEMKEEIKNIKSLLDNRINDVNKICKDSSNRPLYEKSSVFAKESIQLSIPAEKRENINKKTSNKGKNKDNTLEDFKNIIQTKKNENKYNYYFFKPNTEIDNEFLELLIKSINFHNNKELNTNQVYELGEIEKKNQEINSKIKKQLASYKRNQENYMMKKATFLKNVGFLVRLSNEIANYIIIYLIKIFEELYGIHSIEEETIRLNFASWIKNTFDQQFFWNNINSQNILSLIKEISHSDENNFFMNLYPFLVQIYFLCFMTTVKVSIIYAKEDEEYDFDRMSDDLFADSEAEKKVLFTFLPGLFANNQFFKNSTIHIVTYKVDEPNKFKFKKPIFSNIESKINIDYVTKIKKVELFYAKKSKKKNGNVNVEFNVISEPDIIWDHPKFEFELLDAQNYIFNDFSIELKEANYGRCICRIFLNNEIVATSIPIQLDLRK